MAGTNFSPPAPPPPPPSAGELMRESTRQSQALLASQERAANRAARNAYRQFPAVSSAAKSKAISVSKTMDEYLAARFQKNLGDLYPNWREDFMARSSDAIGRIDEAAQSFAQNIMPRAMETADQWSQQMFQNIGSMLEGELPPDVMDKVRRSAAEVAQQVGARGQAAQYLTARDLGRTSLDMIQLGHQLAPGALALAPDAYAKNMQVLGMPIAAATDAANLTKGLMPPTSDPTQLYGAHLSALLGGTQVPASSVFQSAGITQRSALQASQWSYNAQQQQYQQQAQMAALLPAWEAQFEYMNNPRNSGI